MNIIKSTIFCFLLLLSLAVVMFNLPLMSNSQSKKDIETKGIESQEKNSSDKFESQFLSSYSMLEYKGGSLKEYALSQPLPYIWMLAKDKNSQSSEKTIYLTKETTEILKPYWIKTLNHRYITEVEEFSKEINYQKEDVDLSQSAIDTKNYLVRLPISEEKGIRPFSSEEAFQLLNIIRDDSGEVIKVIKSIKMRNKKH